MSVCSMTGYGRGSAAALGLRVEVELQSLNRKQLDIQVSVPRDFQALQQRVHEALGHVCSRGRITGSVSISWAPSLNSKSVHVDEPLAEAYVRALRKTARRLQLDETLSAGVLLTLPGVVSFEAPVKDMDALWIVVEKALRQAIGRLNRMRRAEGRVLQHDLNERLAALAATVDRIASRAPDVSAAGRAALKTRLSHAGWPGLVEDEQIRREIILFTDRSDIAEEITRLKSHLQQAVAMLKSRVSCGRSLDFLAQEMFREVNTIGAKANDADIARQVVSLKTELERVREQLQNIE